MKIRKTAEQKNFCVNTEWYTEAQLEQMYEDKKICKLSDLGLSSELDCYRVFANDCEEVKVVYCEEYGSYTTVVVLKETKEQINIVL